MAARKPSDVSAYAEFVAARSASMFRTAYLVIGDHQLAEDLLQESLVKVYVAWPRLHEVAKAEAYTRRIIVTTAISWRRRRSFGERPTGVLPETAVTDQTERVTGRDELWNGLHSLPPRQRAAVVLRYCEDLSEAQTAELMGLLGGHRQTTGLDSAGQAARPPGRRLRPSDARPLGGDPMNTFHDLASRVDGVGTPTLDVDGLIAQGEQRLHRRRMTAVLAAVTAVAVIAIGAVLGANVYNHQSSGPVDKPDKHQTTAPTRVVVYSDFSDPFVHFGDRRVPSRQGVLHIDVTDEGFVYTIPAWSPYADLKPDDRVWFSDGGTPEQIGRLCGPSLSREPDGVVTANVGSLVAWVDCTDASTPAIVVLDTSTGREVLRLPTVSLTTEPPPGSRVRVPGECCSLGALIGDHLYLARGSSRLHGGGSVAEAESRRDDRGGQQGQRLVRPGHRATFSRLPR